MLPSCCPFLSRPGNPLLCSCLLGVAGAADRRLSEETSKRTLWSGGIWLGSVIQHLGNRPGAWFAMAWGHGGGCNGGIVGGAAGVLWGLPCVGRTVQCQGLSGREGPACLPAGSRGPCRPAWVVGLSCGGSEAPAQTKGGEGVGRCGSKHQGWRQEGGCRAKQCQAGMGRTGAGRTPLPSGKPLAGPA